MSDDKKLPKDEHLLATGVRIFLGIIVIIFILFGYVIKGSGSGTDKFSNVTLWDALHPTSLINGIGIAFLLVFVFYLSGLWQRFTGTILLPAGSVWPNYAGFAIGILGLIFIWL